MLLFVSFFLRSFANSRIHEVMGTAPNHLKRVSDSNSDTVHEIVIAVQQRNLEVIEKMLLLKSTPGITTLTYLASSMGIS